MKSVKEEKKPSVLRKYVVSHENITSTNREQLPKCKGEPIKIRRHGFIMMLLFCYIFHVYELNRNFSFRIMQWPHALDFISTWTCAAADSFALLRLCIFILLLMPLSAAATTSLSIASRRISDVFFFGSLIMCYDGHSVYHSILTLIERSESRKCICDIFDVDSEVCDFFLFHSFCALLCLVRSCTFKFICTISSIDWEFLQLSCLSFRIFFSSSRFQSRLWVRIVCANRFFLFFSFYLELARVMKFRPF